MADKKFVLTSDGNLVDLDRGVDVEKLPNDSIIAGKNYYGTLYNNFFSFVFNGYTTNVDRDKTEFCRSENGLQRVIGELKDMKRFPKVFPVTFHQDPNGDLYYVMYITVRGIQHRVRMIYDYDHPQYEMRVVVDYPTLDRRYMVGHWYGQNQICYTKAWSRSWTAFRVAAQVWFFLDDYYKEMYGQQPRYYTANVNNSNINIAVKGIQQNLVNRILNDLNKNSSWRF